MDLKALAKSVIENSKNKVASIPPIKQQIKDIETMPRDVMQEQALKLVMAGTTGPLIGNQPKIVGTLTDVVNLSKLNPDDYMGAIGNMRQLVDELLPALSKNKSMQALANKDVASWMQKMAKEIIKKTKIYPSMGE